MFTIKPYKSPLCSLVALSLLLLNFVLIAVFDPATPALADEPNISTPARFAGFDTENTPDPDTNGGRLVLNRLRPGPKPTGLHNLTLAGTNVTVYVPTGLNSMQSVQPLIVLHGMGGNGQTFCQSLLGFAQQNHLLLIAPTFNYDPDYRNPVVVTKEDGVLTARLNQMAYQLGGSMHLRLKQRFLLYGFSRGSQLAHRYALLYPTTTMAVVAIAAGSYTLPLITFNNAPLNFAYGVSDLQNYAPTAFDKIAFNRIPFWVGVGADDTDATAVPREWDAYEGNNRLVRAQAFFNVLKQQNMNVHLAIFPHTGHEVTTTMNDAASTFFKSVLAQP